jgi:hypothetical protein
MKKKKENKKQNKAIQTVNANTFPRGKKKKNKYNKIFDMENH